MKLFEIFAVFVILFYTLPASLSSAPPKNQERSLADNYTAFTEDVKWFFRGISKIAGTAEQMLPNVTTSVAKTRSFSENTRVTFLLGMRHLLVGIREIAMTFEKSFNTDHIKQLHQLKNATNFLHELLSAIKIWFSQIRAFVLHLMNLYNHYIPEVLFGKCLGNYIATTYPERSYYEYPFILFMEVYSSIIPTTQEPQTELTELSTELPAIGTDLNMEQNEISHTDDYKTPYGSKSPRQLDASSSFDLGSVLKEHKIVGNTLDQKSWQICLKLYTAESISRSLKIFFLGI